MKSSIVGRSSIIVGGALFVSLLGGCVDASEESADTSDKTQLTSGSGAVGTILAVGSLGNAEVEIKAGGHVAKIEGPTTLTQQEIVIQPGGHTGWHSHGGLALVTVAAGTLTLFDDHDPCHGTAYPTGTAFLDPGSNHVHIARNLGTTPVTVRVQYINRTGTAIRIDKPAPAGSEGC